MDRHTEFISWLLDLDGAYTGYLLYPSCDDTAWLYAKYANELSKKYTLFSPSVDIIYSLLNKKKLADLARSVHLETPEYFAPLSDDEVWSFASSMQGEWIVKPVTQIGLEIAYKGQVLPSGRNFYDSYKAYQKKLKYHKNIVKFDPNVTWPIIQRYYPQASDAIVSVAGYVSADGVFSSLSSRKILQFPNLFGVGLCFEGLEVNQNLCAGIVRICNMVKYFGVVEAEFVVGDDHRKPFLIDMNPRFYGQMGFEVQRGLPLPDMVYAAATGDQLACRRLLGNVGKNAIGTPTRFGNMNRLMLVLALGSLGGKFSFSNLRNWLGFVTSAGSDYADFTYDASDKWPWVVDMVQVLANCLRHPRDTFRKYCLQT